MESIPSKYLLLNTRAKNLTYHVNKQENIYDLKCNTGDKVPLCYQNSFHIVNLDPVKARYQYSLNIQNNANKLIPDNLVPTFADKLYSLSNV